MNRAIIFDASSISNVSGQILVAPGECVLIRAYNLAPGEQLTVEQLALTVGQIGTSSGVCNGPAAPSSGAAVLATSPFSPCGAQVGPTPDASSFVISQPGYYQLTLPPAALGTAVVEAWFLVGAEACQQAAEQCCCEPLSCTTLQSFFPDAGRPLDPSDLMLVRSAAGECLAVGPFDLCVGLNAFPALPNPALTDNLIVLSGGACFVSTIDQVFSQAVVCDSLVEQPLLAPAAGDTIVVVDAGNNCKRVDGETMVEFFETPWTGISTTPALTIAPGGVNGHGPTFTYDLCADLQALPSCACEPLPGDQVAIIQGGSCVLATWPTVDVCDQLGLLPNGALIVGDTVLVREAGGACKQVLATAFGGGVAFPLLAPDGSCLAPSYSFTTDPTSGMFYNVVNASVIVSDANCTDFIEIGNSVDVNAATSFVRLRGGYLAPGSNCGLIVETNGVERLRIGSQGAWNLNTLGGGTLGDVITSSGSGAPPQWAQVALPAGFAQLLGADGSCLQPTYSFVTSPDSGMFYDPAGVGSVVIGDDNCADSISVGASISITTAAVLRHRYTSLGEWEIGGTPGVAGQAITSAGPGLPPTWAAPSAAVRLNEVADANGSATRSHGANEIVWNWTGFPTAADTALHIANVAGGTELGTMLKVSSRRQGTIIGLQVEAPGLGITQQLLRIGGSIATQIQGADIEVGVNAVAHNVNIRAGNSNSVLSGGGAVNIDGGARGGAVNITGGTGVSPPAPISGGPVRISGGDNTVTANEAGGMLTLRGGGGAGGGPLGINGRIQFDIGTSAAGVGIGDVGRVDNLGNWILTSLNAVALVAAATAGFTYLPRIAAAPVGVPTVGVTDGLPFVAQILGATVVLWAYDGVAWRSAVLV